MQAACLEIAMEHRLGSSDSPSAVSLRISRLERMERTINSLSAQARKILIRRMPGEARGSSDAKEGKHPDSPPTEEEDGKKRNSATATSPHDESPVWQCCVN